MSGGRKLRKDAKWTAEIDAWLRERCPAKEHGFKNRDEIREALNAEFGTDFSWRSFSTHCYERRILLGFSPSRQGYRHREVGSFQRKKGYMRIKVAEPNVWMQYNRYVWEKAHPGESAEGYCVIFLDGDRTNFAPENLERVSRGEHALMKELGERRDMTREERTACLLRARILLARNALLGKDEARRLHNKIRYQRDRRDPERWERRKAYCREMYARKRREDPEWRERHNAKQRERRAKKKRGGEE